MALFLLPNPVLIADTSVRLLYMEFSPPRGPCRYSGGFPFANVCGMIEEN